MGLAYGHEGDKIAKYFTGKGVTVVVLKYRVPRREGIPKHMAAWQDAQRCVRVVRSRAQEWGINPDKIGIMGFSAGGHLTLMTATTSQTNSYKPIDDIDKLPCNVNFAAPVYPAYVLEDGADGPNAGKGNDSAMVGDFAFDEKTPPMCLIHGDEDVYSPMGSVAVYSKLRTMNIPAEMHIYAKIAHGFGGNPTDDHVGDWLNRVYAWMVASGF
jgi:acetyl esterase/lipase